MPDLTQDQRKQLTSFISSKLSPAELRSLCFELDVRFENLPGDIHDEKARELVLYMERRGRLAHLQEALARERSEVYDHYFPASSEEVESLPPVDQPAPESPDRSVAKHLPIWAWVLGVLAVGVLAVWSVRELNWRNAGVAESQPTAEVTEHGTIQQSTATPESAPTRRTSAPAVAPLKAVSSTATINLPPIATINPSPTATITITPQPQAGDIRKVSRGGIEVEQVYIPAGPFIMGSTDADDQGALDDEKPQRTVYLDAFWIDRTETTNQQYAACRMIDSCPSPTQFSSASRPSYYYEVNLAFADYPVIYIDWDAASAYCDWAGARLPTEAEWEKAARGTDGRLFPWGDEPPDCDQANVNLCVGDTSAVGIYLTGASVYGVLDMAGNVWEWVQDNYQVNYYSVAPANNPHGPESGSNKVLRSGAWTHSKERSRSAYRLNDFPQNDYYNYGVRCASD